MNGVLESNSRTMTPKVWFNDAAGELKNPLTINGRLLSHNTRGGSLTYDAGTIPVLKKADGNGICAIDAGPVLGTSACSSIEVAGSQDLERFRVVTRTPDDTRCTLHVTGVAAANRPDILTALTF